MRGEDPSGEQKLMQGGVSQIKLVKLGIEEERGWCSIKSAQLICQGLQDERLELWFQSRGPAQS